MKGEMEGELEGREVRPQGSTATDNERKASK